MAQNDFLEGIRKGMVAFLQTRQMMQQYQGNPLQQETYKMQQEELKRQKQDYMSPQAKADFDFEQGLKRKRAELDLAKEYTEPKTEAWKPRSMDEAVEYKRRIEEIRGKVKGGGGGGGEENEKGIGENFLKLISNLPYEQAIEITEQTFKGSTLIVGKSGKYEIVDKNKEVDPVEAGNMLGDLFARTGRAIKEFSPRKIQEMRKELMSGDPQKMLELESALYAGGILIPFKKKIAQLGDPKLEAALTKSVAEWWLGASDGSIFKDKTAPKSEEELIAQIQDYLVGSSSQENALDSLRYNDNWLVRVIYKHTVGKGIQNIQRGIDRTKQIVSLPGKADAYAKQQEKKYYEKYPKQSFGSTPEKSIANIKVGSIISGVGKKFKITSIEQRNGQTIYKAMSEGYLPYEFSTETLKLQLGVK